MEIEQQISRSRLIRAPEAAGKKPAKSTKPEGRRRSHFVEAYRFDAKQRADLIKTLQKCRLGDQEGQRLFLAALELEIGSIRQLSSERGTPAPAAPPETDARLDALAQAALALQARIEELTPELHQTLARTLAANDRFKRAYGPDYLQEIGNELRRLTHACTAGGPEPHASPPPADEETSARFYVVLSNAYSQCFDHKPSLGKRSPFLRVARRIIELTEICVRDDPSFIAGILERP